MENKANIKIVFLKNNMVYICAVAALLVPDFLLRYLVTPKMFGEPFVTVIPTVMNLFWIGLVLYIFFALLPRRVGRAVFIVFTVMENTLTFSNYIYFKIFGQFFWLSSVGLVGEAGDYVRYALQYIDWKVILFTLVSLAFMTAAAVMWKKPFGRPNLRRALYTLVPVAGIVLMNVFMQPSLFGVLEDDWDSWSKPRVIYKQFTDVNKSFDVAGLYQFVARDLWNTWFPHNSYAADEYAEVDKYFAEKSKPTQNEYTGIFEGKNVIAVMMESMDDWLISEKYTPAIKYMMDNGINLANHFAPTFGTGYTFNTEFTFNTGFHTPKSTVTAVNFSSNAFPYSLPRLFKEKGYSANSFHYNSPEFYNRGIMHKSFGYDAYHSFMKYGLPSYAAQADSNILKNDKIYKDMVKGDKFFDFVVTYSVHLPYTYSDAKLDLAKRNHPDLVDPNMDEETNNCMLLARDTDDFFAQLLRRLNDDGLLENTVIVAFADHYAYGFSNSALLMKYSREAGSGLLYKVPAFIYTPGIKPVTVTKVTQSADLLPTVVNLFGLNNKNYYIGSDAFDESYTGLAYFENRSWFDGKTYYVPDETKITDKNKSYIESVNKKVAESIDVDDIVIAGDYFGKRK